MQHCLGRHILDEKPRQTLFFKTCFGCFQGGGCRAAALVGALDEAFARGVRFAGVAGTSAGAIVASLVGAGASASQLKQIVTTIDFNQFMMSPEPIAHQNSLVARCVIPFLGDFGAIWKFGGRFSSMQIEKWLESHLESLLPNARRPVKFGDLAMPTWVVATDLKTRGIVVWSSEKTPEVEIAHAVRASCSIPLFFQPVESRYVDGGVLSNLPSFVFNSLVTDRQSTSSRILAFALRSSADDQAEHGPADRAKALVATVVDGGQELQLTLQPNVHRIEIDTKAIDATDFDKMDSSKVEFLLSAGIAATKNFFDQELMRVETQGIPQNICFDEDEMYAAVADQLAVPTTEILIAEAETSWVYLMFPALLYWRNKGIPIRAFVNRTGDDARHGPYRRRLLRALGVELTEVDAIPFECHLFDPKGSDFGRAVVRIPQTTEAAKYEAIRYLSPYDFPAISALRRELEILAKNEDNPPATVPQILGGKVGDLVSAIRTVRQYQKDGVSVNVEKIPIASIVSLTPYAREKKYRQTPYLVRLYLENGLELFEPAYVGFGEGKSSLITPPVVEESGDKFILIEGTNRATYCRDNGLDSIICVVVRNVRDSLPAKQRIDLKNLIVVGRTLRPVDRYDGFSLPDFRPIERAVHPLDGLQ